jgi:hypothetical protein
MRNKLLAAAAATLVVAATGVALAQQDANNPAPQYSAMPAAKNQNVQHIQDGNNGAPRYGSVSPAGPHENVQHIQDGVNGAPRYSTVAPAGANQQPARGATTTHRTTHASRTHKRVHHAS